MNTLVGKNHRLKKYPSIILPPAERHLIPCFFTTFFSFPEISYTLYKKQFISLFKITTDLNMTVMFPKTKRTPDF